MDKSKRFEHPVIPITWESWDEVEILIVNFYNVEFFRGFGVFAKGEKCETVTFDCKNGTLTQFGPEGEELKVQKFQAQWI